MNNVLAVDIGGTRFRAGLFDEAGRRLLVSEGDTSHDGGREWMLEQIARHCLKTTRLAGGFHSEPPLPDIPADAAAQTVWLLLKG